MDGCIYRTKDGECDLYAEGGKFTAFCDMEHCDNIAPTNADHIRSMTDEELADFLIGVAQRGGVPCGEKLLRWLDWLKQEAE